MRNDPHPKGSPQYINKLNKIKILNLIRENGPISRADAAKHSGISAPTVTRIVDSLIQENLVHEIGTGVSRGGRRPTLLEFSGNDNLVIGIDLGTTHIYGVLSNFAAETVAEIKCDTHIDEDFLHIMDRTAGVICELRNHRSVKGKKIFGVGLAVAGLINRWKNIIEYSPDFHWKNADVVKALSAKCELPIIFDNVTRVMALGELWYGIGNKVKNFIVVNIGYGIGAGIIINGKPLYGPKGMAGEFGHITLDKDSDLQCECGNLGCLEALASGRAIAFIAQRELKRGVKSKLSNITDITAEHVALAAKAGDAVAQNIFNQATEYLSIGIASLVNLISPQAVLLGGGVSQAGELLFEPLKKMVFSRILNPNTTDLVIQPVTYGIKAAAMGSLALILHEVLNLNHIHYTPENDRIQSNIETEELVRT
jgi:glucokinase-like ROK family protein